MSINISLTLWSERYFRIGGVWGVVKGEQNLFRFIGIRSKASIEIGEKKFETYADQKLVFIDDASSKSLHFTALCLDINRQLNEIRALSAINL